MEDGVAHRAGYCRESTKAQLCSKCERGGNNQKQKWGREEVGCRNDKKKTEVGG